MLVHGRHWSRIIVSDLCADVFAILFNYSLHQKISESQIHQKIRQKIANIENPNKPMKKASSNLHRSHSYH
jgi:hypothetical protein